MSALDELARHGGDGFPNLRRARERTEEELGRLREQLGPVRRDDDVSIVLFGSWGRRELTGGSDDDWALLVAGPERPEVDPPHDRVEQLLGTDKGPGQQGVFGDAVFSDHLVENIGLDADVNRNLTRRVLLLLESVPVIGHEIHTVSVQRVLEGYLDDAVKDYRPPRFLLNDVIRYWRTICVDFVGKQRQGVDQRWALRDLKLQTSRKMLFAGGLLPVLLCHRQPRSGMGSYLADQLTLPSVDRVAAAFLEHGAADAGIRAIGAYDRWLGLLDDPDVRSELEHLARSDAPSSAHYLHGKRLAAELEQGLLSLMFETPLQPLVREFGIF